MKVLLFTDSLGAGGAQRQLVGLGALLKEQGEDVTVITYHRIEFYKNNLDERNIPNEILAHGENKITRLLALCSYIKSNHPDIIIAYQETPSFLACVAKIILMNFRLIVSERNTTQRETFRDKLRFWLYRKADVIVPNSYSQADFLSRRYPSLNRKIFTITNFVDLDLFVPVSHERQRVPIILVVGSISLSKNTKRYIEACHLLVERGFRFKTVLLGWSDSPDLYMREVRELVNQYDLQNVVFFKNKTPEVIPFYQSSDYYCIPSLYEGTPNVLCEAISCGLPVAASNVCDNTRYVIEGQNGFLFDPSSSVQIADAIQCLFNLSDEEYIAYRAKSRSIAMHLLSKELFLNKYMEIFC